MPRTTKDLHGRQSSFERIIDRCFEEQVRGLLVITGIAADNCVLFTASDAYLRDYRVRVPSDCVASIDAADKDAALELMRRTFKADTRPSGELHL